MINIRHILPKYFDILEENGFAGYLKCKYNPVFFSKSESTADLWKKHNLAIKNIKLCRYSSLNKFIFSFVLSISDIVFCFAHLLALCT